MSDGLNFRVVENAPTNDEVFYEEFKKEYLECKVPVNELRRKYSLNNNKEYPKIINRIQKETGFKRSRGKLNPNYIYKNKKNNRFVINKEINGVIKSFGSYTDEDIAKQVVTKLKEVDWDKTLLNKIKSEIGL